MEKESIEIRKQNPPEIKKDTYNNYGNGPQIGRVDNLVLPSVDVQALSEIQRLLSQQHNSIPCCTRNELFELSHQNYHLFVLEKEYYDKGVFSVGKTVTLEYTEEDMWERYYSFDAAVIRELLSMPAILATKNRQQGRTDDGHTFRVAKIDKITDQGETFCIEFRTDGQDRKQQLLNEHCEELGIATAFLRTELDEIHWAIKEGNLLGILAELGI